MSFGQRVAYIREREGLKQKELALRLGIEPRKLSDYERGVNRPPDEMMVKIAIELDVSMDFLMGLNDEIVSYKRTDVIVLPKSFHPDDILKAKEYIRMLQKIREDENK